MAKVTIEFTTDSARVPLENLTKDIEDLISERLNARAKIKINGKLNY